MREIRYDIYRSSRGELRIEGILADTDEMTRFLGRLTKDEAEAVLVRMDKDHLVGEVKDAINDRYKLNGDTIPPEHSIKFAIEIDEEGDD